MQHMPSSLEEDNPAPPAGSRVVVAMSGGVDSAVVALMLRERGYDVVGVNLRVWEYEASCDPRKKSCCSPEDIQDARAVGMQIDIPFYVLRMEKVFEEKVMDRFVRDYSHARTPNPCVECNTFVKFGALFSKARDLNIETIATGHYAGIRRLPNGRYAIRTGRDERKNQAYYLYGLSQEVLKATYFPLADMTKAEVRDIARRHGLVVADKEESQEICFIPDNDYREFLEKKGVAFTPGYFRDEEGRILGKHSGREKFTVGQRKGLGIAWKEPLYVLRIEESGDVILGPVDRTLCTDFVVEQVHCMGLSEEELKNLTPGSSASSIEGRVQVRYRSTPVRCRVSFLEESSEISFNGLPVGMRLHVELLEPVSSVTPGQSAVFFPPLETTPSDWVMMGGIIALH
ncbi:tRNA (5-methylaminomethyl-2-thiouridylate)-methyltransferase [Leptonema illini DSM 21528]|uniref:tRNA-specific 2-thiouridylase MnmA n=1 Tax=Leptonema illini DSM 21528 TaxID=929563 RepID=H2CEP6_9LEPT|nr:tRNA (5-methylaminomethyl-2-thiouridylate)-methyltransferase [Leptonema illini DSM 21528]